MAEIIYFPMDIHMSDLMFIGVIIVFFVVSYGLIRFLEILRRSD